MRESVRIEVQNSSSTGCHEIIFKEWNWNKECQEKNEVRRGEKE